MEMGSKCTPLTVIASQSLVAPTLAVSRSHRNPLLENICKDLGVEKEVSSGSVGLKIGLIARGIADMYIEPGPYTKLWDACGPDAILRATGGQFTNMLGESLTSAITQLKNTHGLVATNGAMHEKVINGLKPIAKELGLTPSLCKQVGKIKRSV